MTALAERIKALIAVDGPLSLDRYMAACLYDPQHGYYTTREPFGRGGDFITAPEISQMFGELVGAWLINSWKIMGSPANPAVTEIGPGRGTLFLDLLRTIAKADPELFAAADFRLVETSGRLSCVQRETLRAQAERVSWHGTVDDLPEKPLFIVGNEIFDAVPMRQIVKDDSRWLERAVGVDATGALCLTARPVQIVDILPVGAPELPDGTIVEYAPARSALMGRIAQHIALRGGCGLFFDYGYRSSGFGDTFQAVRRHRLEGVLDNPGEADLTSHVDFADLAKAAQVEGLATAVMDQGDFLLDIGLVERAGALGAEADEKTRADIRATVHRLAGPDQMGSLFKVLVVMPMGMHLPPFHCL